MNVTKTEDVKKQIDVVQSSLNSVNSCLNNMQFDSSVSCSYARESLNKIEEVGDKLVGHIDTTKTLLTGLAEKVGKVHLSKVEKPVPNSFLVKRNIKIENPVRNIHKFPSLFPKEIVSSSDADKSEHISIASLFQEAEAEAEAKETEKKPQET